MSKKIWLVLSGGWARGFAHIWAYQAVMEAGRSVEVVSGASMWAVVGMMIAMGKTPLQMVDIYSNIDIPLIPKNELTSGYIVGKFRDKLWKKIPKQNIEDLKIPFAVSTTCLNDGNNKMFVSGDLEKIVSASGSLPIINKHVVIDGKAYIDWGITDNLPAKYVKDNFTDLDLIIWIDVNQYSTTTKTDFDSRQVLMRSVAILFENGTQKDKPLCDIYVCPEELTRYGMFDFDKIHELIDIWYQATKKQIENYK
jgi:NTE family protein